MDPISGTELTRRVSMDFPSHPGLITQGDRQRLTVDGWKCDRSKPPIMLFRRCVFFPNLITGGAIYRWDKPHTNHLPRLLGYMHAPTIVGDFCCVFDEFKPRCGFACIHMSDGIIAIFVAWMHYVLFLSKGSIAMGEKTRLVRSLFSIF